MAKKIKRFSLKKLLLNRKFTVTVSVILAIIIWFAVVINRNPVRERTFSDLTVTVPIENTYISEMGLGIVSDISSTKFKVTVSGPNYVVSSLKSEDIALNASVAFANINEAGVRTLKVEGKPNSDKTGYNFISVSPDTINVVFDYFDTKSYTVIPKIDGAAVESNTDNLIADTEFVAGNSLLEIKGPRSVMNKITTVTAYAKVDRKLSKTESFNADLYMRDADGKVVYRYAYDNGGYKVYDADGNVVENNFLTLNNNTPFTVTRPISKKVTLSVKPQFKDIPAGIKESSISYKIDTSSVTVVGTPDIVSEIDAIYLEPISFNDISGSGSSALFGLNPILTDGVRIIDNINSFNVTVNTSSYSEKSFTVSAVKPKGLQSGLNFSTTDKIINVKICGLKKDILSLKAADLYAEIDLAGKSEGQYSLVPVIKSDKYNAIWVHGSAGEITVTVK